MQPSTQGMVAHVYPTPGTTTRCPPYAHMPPPRLCSAPLHLALLVISTEHVESLFPGEKCVSEPPSASPLHDWMVKGEPDSFIGVLCTLWVFYRDANKRNDDENMPYRPLFFARVTSENHGPFIMRMHECRMVQSSKSTHGLTLSWPFRTPCEGTICAAHLDFTSSPQMCLRTQELGIRSVDKDGHCQAATNRFRRMANLCDSITCA
jgi:hypothetical protein